MPFAYLEILFKVNHHICESSRSRRFSPLCKIFSLSLGFQVWFWNGRTSTFFFQFCTHCQKICVPKFTFVCTAKCCPIEKEDPKLMISWFCFPYCNFWWVGIPDSKEPSLIINQAKNFLAFSQKTSSKRDFSK